MRSAISIRPKEIAVQKPPKELKLDATGQGITVKDVQNDQQCQVSSGGSRDGDCSAPQLA